MEMLVFWVGVVAVWLFFHLTTPAQRRRLVWNFWGTLFLAGAAGALWSLLQ